MGSTSHQTGNTSLDVGKWRTAPSRTAAGAHEYPVNVRSTLNSDAQFRIGSVADNRRVPSFGSAADPAAHLRTKKLQMAHRRPRHLTFSFSFVKVAVHLHNWERARRNSNTSFQYSYSRGYAAEPPPLMPSGPYDSDGPYRGRPNGPSALFASSLSFFREVRILLGAAMTSQSVERRRRRARLARRLSRVSIRRTAKFWSLRTASLFNAI
jgi:hypothetical protein